MSGNVRSLKRLGVAVTLSVQGLVVAAHGSHGSAPESALSALELDEAGHLEEAASRLRPLADRGSAEAQLHLATLYRTGKGVPADEYEAAYWYAKAAQQGVAEAQFHLGLMFLRGEGVTENSQRALEWISRAAQQGYGDAIAVFDYILTNDEALAC